nr:unnamed protein product [Callosobruchus analis]
MFQSVLYVAVCIVLHLVSKLAIQVASQHEERIKYLANQIQKVTESEAIKIALAKDAMEETVNDAVESIEEQLLELRQIADVIKQNNPTKSCLQTTMLISNINLDPLRDCKCSSSFDFLKDIVDKAAKLSITLKNVIDTCKSVDLQDNCENEILGGIQRSIPDLTETIDESIDQITSSYLSCIQEELAAIDKTLNDIGHQVKKCV